MDTWTAETAGRINGHDYKQVSVGVQQEDEIRIAELDFIELL